jgi:hypothetical protein
LHQCTPCSREPCSLPIIIADATLVVTFIHDNYLPYYYIFECRCCAPSQLSSMTATSPSMHKMF